jgi:hypothetical protein
MAIALVVIAIGVVMSAIIFDMGFSFFSTTMNQESLYVDHVAATDYVEAAKGWLVKYNLESPTGVMHALLRPSPDIPVTSLNDLMLDDPEGTPLEKRYLSFDREIAYNRGAVTKIAVNVFDVHYFKENIAPNLLNDPVQMRFMPPPINAVGGTAIPSGGMASEGDATTPDVGVAEKAFSSFYPWDSYGAYVVRVQLYDVDKSGRRILKRVTDEAFFQVLSNDAL